MRPNKLKGLLKSPSGDVLSGVEEGFRGNMAKGQLAKYDKDFSMRCGIKLYLIGDANPDYLPLTPAVAFF